MKKNPKKLNLNRETIQQLESGDLFAVVNGAARTDDFTTCAIGTCCHLSSCLC